MSKLNVVDRSELEIRASKELNENQKTRDQDLKHLRDWIAKQPHLGKHIRQGQVKKGFQRFAGILLALYS